MPNRPSPRPRRLRGVTLPELMTTLAVLAVTTTVGVPGLGRMVSDHRAATRINALVGALALARSEAVSAASQAALCPYADTGAAAPAERYVCTDGSDWSGGWIVYRIAADEAGNPTTTREIVRVIEAAAGGGTLSGPDHPLTFLPTGFLADVAEPGGEAEQFTLAPPACAAQPLLRRITVSLQGQSQLSLEALDHASC